MKRLNELRVAKDSLVDLIDGEEDTLAQLLKPVVKILCEQIDAEEEKQEDTPKLKVFEVHVTRTYLHKGRIQVPAETGEDAVAMALDEISNTELSIACWLEGEDTAEVVREIE